LTPPTERALAVLAAGVLGLQVAAAALPIAVPAGPLRALDPTAGEVVAGAPSVARDGGALVVRGACPTCRAEVAWPAEIGRAHV
jgi:hypothetical protein